MMTGCVQPASRVRGKFTNITKRAEFPRFLGMFSSGAKNGRLLHEVEMHVRTATGAADKSSVLFEYLPLFYTRAVVPLEKQGKDGIDDAIGFMDEYGLSREDWDTIVDLNSTLFAKDKKEAVAGSVKTAFTRRFNEGHAGPVVSQIRGKKNSDGMGLSFMNNPDEEKEIETVGSTHDDDDDDDNDDNDGSVTLDPNIIISKSEGKKRKGGDSIDKRPSKKRKMEKQ